jgi:hypothetical protein
MKRNDNIYRIDPVCKFGPGGDFVSNWPGKPVDYLKHSQSPLTKLLYSISKLINAAQAEHQQEYSVNITEGTNAAQPNTKTIPTSSSNSDVQGQTLLFADDSRTGTGTVHKQKHRVRTHRRTTKKRPAIGIAGQQTGTLFETNGSGVKTA